MSEKKRKKEKKNSVYGNNSAVFKPLLPPILHPEHRKPCLRAGSQNRMTAIRAQQTGRQRRNIIDAYRNVIVLPQDRIRSLNPCLASGNYPLCFHGNVTADKDISLQQHGKIARIIFAIHR